MTVTKIKIRQPTCPWWFLFTFDNPLRRFYQDPEIILYPYLRTGDIAVDTGCGMGYFTLPIAKLVGASGSVIAVDLQSRMLSGLKKRAQQAGLLDRIELHQCNQRDLGIQGSVDFVLAFWMVHEVHHPRSFFKQVYQILKNGGQLLIVEPYIHVTGKKFRETIAIAEAAGFFIIEKPNIGFSRSALVQK